MNCTKHRDKVFYKDVIQVLKDLPDNSLDMIYGDPDYNVGINYAGKTYKRTWEEYIKWYIKLTKESLRVMKPTANAFFINYPKQNAHLRVKYLDDNAYDVQDYAWVYNTNVGHSKKRFTTAHRSVLHFTKTKNNCFYKEQVAMPYKNPEDRRIKQRMVEGHNGRMPYSWFYFDLVKNVSKDKTFHACQIPQGLFEMLVKASTQEQDDIFILFGGSGSEIMASIKMKRHYISCEINKKYWNMIKDRINSNDKQFYKYRLNNNINNGPIEAGRQTDKQANRQFQFNR